MARMVCKYDLWGPTQVLIVWVLSLGQCPSSRATFAARPRRTTSRRPFVQGRRAHPALGVAPFTPDQQHMHQPKSVDNQAGPCCRPRRSIRYASLIAVIRSVASRRASSVLHSSRSGCHWLAIRLYAALICSRVLVAVTPRSRRAWSRVMEWVLSKVLSQFPINVFHSCDVLVPVGVAGPSAKCSGQSASWRPAMVVACTGARCSAYHARSCTKDREPRPSRTGYARHWGSYPACRYCLCFQFSTAVGTPSVQVSSKKSGSGNGPSPSSRWTSLANCQDPPA